MTLMTDTRAEDVRALRAEIDRLKTTIRTLRGLMALDEALLNPPPPMPSLMVYGHDVDDVVAAIQRRGVHATEAAWLADFIRDLDDIKTRAGD